MLVGNRSQKRRELIEMLALSRSQKLPQGGEDTQILELLVQRDKEFQELMRVAHEQGKVHQEMQVLEKEVEKRDSDIQQLQKQLKEAEHILATAVYQAKEKLKSIDKAKKGSISSEEIIKYAHRISASNAVCAPLNWVPGDPRRPYPTDLEMRSGLLGHMSNLPTNGVNGHLPGDALAAGRLPGICAHPSVPLAIIRCLSGHAPSSPWQRLWAGAPRVCVCLCLPICVCISDSDLGIGHTQYLVDPAIHHTHNIYDKHQLIQV
uniref:Mediator of RNA polymerase II transcription subunit 4 n=1 Tax=Oncorhynchus mykiss TaxID=8022 RepID=A0A8C7NM00_ONCMY